MVQIEKTPSYPVKTVKYGKLIIPEEVQRKIRECCYQSYNTEWSGILFYTPNTSLEVEEPIFTVNDFFVMDIGSSTYTEFSESPEVVSYMIDNDLLDCKYGLIHSHNTFSTFFSGTDLSTLNEEGNDTIHFLSLIVNNAGSYTAAITRKVVYNEIVTKSGKYTTFDGNEVIINESTVEKEPYSVIEYLPLNIIIEGDYSLANNIFERFNEIKSKKIVVQENNPIIKAQPNIVVKQPTLFDNTESDKSTEGNSYSITDEELKHIMCQIVYCSPMVSNKTATSVNLKEFVSKRMVTVYKARFHGEDVGIGDYVHFIDAYLDFILQDAANKMDGTLDAVEFIASQLIIAFTELEETNSYIEEILNVLNYYASEQSDGVGESSIL